MPQFEYDSTSIYFEEHGSGFPLLLIAPGAMNSIIEMWANATINPLALCIDTSLRSVGRVRARPAGAARPSGHRPVPRHGLLHRRVIRAQADRTGTRPRRGGGPPAARRDHRWQRAAVRADVAFLG